MNDTENKKNNKFKPITKEELEKEENEKTNKKDTKKKKNTKKETKIKKERNKTLDKTKKHSKKRKKKFKKIIVLIGLLLILVIIGFVILSIYNKNQNIKISQENLYQDIIKHYNKYVITNKEAKLYKKDNNTYTEVGTITKEEELNIDDMELTYKTEYFKINTFEKGYYIHYSDVDKIEELTQENDKYKKYIVFNKNIITKDTTNFYDKEGNLVYTLPESFNFPIIVNKKDIYGIEFNNRLLYVKKEDVEKEIDNKNTDKTNTKGIAVLNYHFFFDTSISGDAEKCNQVICMSTTNLKKHLDYIKDNDIFTPSMEELEMYIDREIMLPKSVVLTIDDGWRAGVGSDVMAEYKINATIFLMSKYYDPKKYKNEYIEVHSHGHDLHNPGICPGGQGGAIKCLEKSKLLEDLKASREKLSGSTVFCYPFYEYNNYSIEVLKEAGFTMAFGGYGEGGKLKVTPGSNKFKLPRYVIYSYTSVNNIKNYIG